MSQYFKYFPKIKYDDRVARDITRRVAFRTKVFSDPYAFLPYLIQSDDRPEDVAHFYYGDVKYTWVVYFSNQMIDPYHDWPLNTRDFDRYIMNKYANEANTTGYGVVAWAQNTLITDNIIEYRSDDDDELIISPKTYELDPTIVEGDWTAWRVYDYESELNDNKRSIVLLDRKYISIMDREIEEIMANG